MPIPTKIFDFNNFSFLNVVSSLEMLIMYIIYIGFIISFFKKFNKIVFLMPVIFLSIIFIILLSYIIPYLGTLYRMRSPFFLIFYIVGISAYIELFYSRYTNKIK